MASPRQDRTRVAEAAGVPDDVWSSRARHGGGTEAREAGAPIDDIADHLQKSDVEGTRRDYIVGNVETTRRVARKRVASAEGRGQRIRLLTYLSNFKGKERTVNQPPHGFAGSSPASPTI